MDVVEVAEGEVKIKGDGNGQYIDIRVRLYQQQLVGGRVGSVCILGG